MRCRSLPGAHAGGHDPPTLNRIPRPAGRAALTVAGAALRLPRLDPVVARPEELAGYEVAAERIMAAGGGVVTGLPDPPMRFLRWLAENRPVLFHGSVREDLSELQPVRFSSDPSAFGNQNAVFATPDPVWASWFAVVRRSQGFRSMRNGSTGVAGGGVYPRWYYLSLDIDHTGPERFRSGSLYVLPSEGFTPEAPELGFMDTGQLVSTGPVPTLARIPIDPADVPLVDRATAHAPGESQLRTMLRFGWRPPR